MHTFIIVVIAIHLLAGVFWAGSTFVLAHRRAQGAEALFRAQMIAAAVAILAGIALWGPLVQGAVGGTETTLSVGAACALVAAAVQIAWRKQPVLSQRVAAVLLAVTVVTMGIAPYVT
ncbi:MAG: hypothetical protein ACRETB_05700 [Steroidobacteraceae bacterium]